MHDRVIIERLARAGRRCDLWPHNYTESGECQLKVWPQDHRGELGLMGYSLGNRFFKCAIVILGITIAATAARASEMMETQSFTITVSPPAALPGSTDTLFPGTAFPLFNPAQGMLDSVSATLMGSATWTTTDIGPLDTTLEISPSLLLAAQNFGTPAGLITLDLMDTNDTRSAVLTFFTGTGNAVLDLDLFVENDSTFETNPSLSGAVTYTYTPAVAPVPEPASLTLFGAALLSFGVVRHRRREIARQTRSSPTTRRQGSQAANVHWWT